jgi:hypothetical protein
MKRPVLLASAAALLLAAVAASAQVTKDNFVLRTSADLVALGGVSPNDPNATAAIHFCEGYLVGLEHFADVTGRPFLNTLYCPPAGLSLSRDQVVAMIVSWHRKNPGPAAETPFDGIARWAVATWPCKK